MNTQATARTLFIACMVFASSAFATDINKCVDASGLVTLTDAVCPGGTHASKVISGPSDNIDESTAAAPVSRPTVEHYAAQRVPARTAPFARATAPARGLSLDIATLKAARANMLLVDNAAQSTRSQRLAGLQ